ncbi:MAG TPA: response regulator [Rhizomicrobium sp.]|nr:response regulator [Rhizomicrobium sp.]
MTPTNGPDPCVFLVDDDCSILAAFSRLLGSAGYKVRAFSSPADFLAAHDRAMPGCALLDVGMIEMDGLALQRLLRQEGVDRPVIFVTGQDDLQSGISAMKNGAMDYLSKPVGDEALLAAVGKAIALDCEARRERGEVAALRALFDTLTPREREVMMLVVRGRLNKQIANDLGVVEKTVKVHRARVMEKMRVRSVAALVQIAGRLAGAGRTP